jgi:hypothetical protein
VVRGRFCKRCQVPGITGQDPIAWAGQQDDGCVNRIAGASYAQQDTGLAAVLETHRADIHAHSSCAKPAWRPRQTWATTMALLRRDNHQRETPGGVLELDEAIKDGLRPERLSR